MNTVFTKTSGVVLAIALLCSTISAMAMNADPVKDVIVVTGVNTVKEVAKTSEMATVASNLWLNTKTLMSMVAKQGTTFIKNHRTAVIGGLLAAGAIFAGYKCIKYFKAKPAPRNVRRGQQNRKAASSEDAMSADLINNYLARHPEIKDRDEALARVIEEQGNAIDKAIDQNTAATTEKQQ